METQTLTAEAAKAAGDEPLELRLKKAEDELEKKCAEIVVLQQALENLTKRVVSLESSSASKIQVYPIANIAQNQIAHIVIWILLNP